VGSVLTGLLFYADSVIGPTPLPFSVSQMAGLPQSDKPQMIAVEVHMPIIKAENNSELRVETKKAEQNASQIQNCSNS
jgi:hypothetical protein